MRARIILFKAGRDTARNGAPLLILFGKATQGGVCLHGILGSCEIRCSPRLGSVVLRLRTGINAGLLTVAAWVETPGERLPLQRSKTGCRYLLAGALRTSSAAKIGSCWSASRRCARTLLYEEFNRAFPTMQTFSRRTRVWVRSTTC